MNYDLMPAEDILMKWSFPEFRPEIKSNRWYLWFGVGIAVFIISAIITDNYLFAVIIILFSLIIFLRNWRTPANIDVAISSAGIVLDDRFYKMNEFEEFWIVYDPPTVDMIYFELKAPWRSTLGIPLAGNNPVEVRALLLDYIIENLEKEEEPLIDGVARALKLD